MELLALLESQNTNYSMVPKAYAVSLANRYPVTKGSNLGIILSSASGTLNQPLQSLVTGTFDVMNSGATNYTAYQSTTSTIV
jgi:hypothetical protein